MLRITKFLTKRFLITQFLVTILIYKVPHLTNAPKFPHWSSSTILKVKLQNFEIMVKKFKYPITVAHYWLLASCINLLWYGDAPRSNPPLPHQQASVSPPPGWGHTRLPVIGGRGSQFGRLEKKPSRSVSSVGDAICRPSIQHYRSQSPNF